MKKIFLLLSVITLVSCHEQNHEKSAVKNTKIYHQIKESNGITITVYEYRMSDGCQYIGYIETNADDRSYYLTHKGLCDNPKHKQ